MEKILNNFKLISKWLVLTNIGRMVLAFVWFLIFWRIDARLSHTNLYNGWAFWLYLISITYWLVFILILLIFAWIINPIKEHMEMKETKEEYEQSLKNEKNIQN